MSRTFSYLGIPKIQRVGKELFDYIFIYHGWQASLSAIERCLSGALHVRLQAQGSQSAGLCTKAHRSSRGFETPAVCKECSREASGWAQSYETASSAQQTMFHMVGKLLLPQSNDATRLHCM